VRWGHRPECRYRSPRVSESPEPPAVFPDDESSVTEKRMVAPCGGEENARPRGQARRWASPCSNSPRAARTRAIDLDETCRGACSDGGALRNCARRGPRRPCPRVTRHPCMRPPRKRSNCGELLVSKLAGGGTGSTRRRKRSADVSELRHEHRAALTSWHLVLGYLVSARASSGHACCGSRAPCSPCTRCVYGKRRLLVDDTSTRMSTSTNRRTISSNQQMSISKDSHSRQR
jgi:hypothetical protein